MFYEKEKEFLMLVLSRKLNESIVINDNIVITVVGLDSSGRVRLGIDAPRDISINRGEIHTAILKAAKVVPIASLAGKVQSIQRKRGRD